MKILLVRPLVRNPLAVFGAMDCEPLELYYLAAACRERGMEPVIYDAVTERTPLARVLVRQKPDAMLLTGYLTQEKIMHTCLRTVRRICPGCVTVVGGVHAQLNYTRLYWPEVDYIYRSEDVRTLAAFLTGAVRKEDVSGLCFRTENGWTENPYIPADMDDLPLPERMGWKEQARWFRYFDWERTSTLKTAAACPYNCSFCYGRNLHGGRYQARSLERVLDELEQMEAERVFIVDSDFLLERSRVEAFLDGLERRRIRKKFVCYARADFIAQNPDLVKRLTAAGVCRFAVGLEGIEDVRLRGWQKGTSRSVNELCVETIHVCGGECVALLLADPAYGREEFAALWRWVGKMRLKYVSVQILTPIPPTPYYRQQKGNLTERDPAHWTLTRLVLPPEKMSVRGFMACYRLLLAGCAVLGWLRGGYRFVTPAYLWRVLVRDLQRRKLFEE